MLVKKEKREQNKTLRKSIINATFGLIIRKLEEKCKMLNKTFIQCNFFILFSYFSLYLGFPYVSPSLVTTSDFTPISIPTA